MKRLQTSPSVSSFPNAITTYTFLHWHWNFTLVTLSLVDPVLSNLCWALPWSAQVYPSYPSYPSPRCTTSNLNAERSSNTQTKISHPKPTSQENCTSFPQFAAWYTTLQPSLQLPSSRLNLTFTIFVSRFPEPLTILNYLDSLNSSLRAKLFWNAGSTEDPHSSQTEETVS